MGLSEHEIEARLAALRRQREALDREIADLVLYLELGRRLSGTPGGLAGSDRGGSAFPDRMGRPTPGLKDVAAPDRAVGTAVASRPDPVRLASTEDVAPREARPLPSRMEASGIPPAIAFTEDAAGARRYGRALVEAACAAIAAAGRPLHAGEILEILLARGFTLPGRDPVAALNTRLWKRAGPGGPLRRVAEATYALAHPPGSETRDEAPGL